MSENESGGVKSGREKASENSPVRSQGRWVVKAVVESGVNVDRMGCGRGKDFAHRPPQKSVRNPAKLKGKDEMVETGEE